MGTVVGSSIQQSATRIIVTSSLLSVYAGCLLESHIPQPCQITQPCEVGRPDITYSHFTGEETEAQSSKRICPESQKVHD